MQEYYRIHPSRVLFGLSLAAHGLIALAISVYVDSNPLKYGGMALVLLFAWRECAGWIRQRSFSLGFDPHSQSITLVRAGQPYFQGKYKVYPNRWFAILKLIDKPKNRTLILHRLRFDTDRSYRHLRFALAQEVRKDVA